MGKIAARRWHRLFRKPVKESKSLSESPLYLTHIYHNFTDKKIYL